MNGRIVLSILLVLILIGLLAGIGGYMYNVGVAQGMADSGKLTTPAQGVTPYPYYGPFFFRPFWFGFGFLGWLVPLFGLFLFFGLLRWIFWGGPWGWRGSRYYGSGVPPTFEEWHRKAHEPKPEER
jgi:hypothetical protein